MLQRKLGTRSGDFLKFCQKKNYEIFKYLSRTGRWEEDSSGIPCRCYSHKCQLLPIFFSFILPSFTSLFLHFCLSFLLPRLVCYFFLLFFYPLFLSFVRKNADKECNDKAQFQCRPEGENIQFNCTAVISSMYLQQQTVYRLATGWTVRESKPGGREISYNRLE